MRRTIASVLAALLLAGTTVGCVATGKKTHGVDGKGEGLQFIGLSADLDVNARAEWGQKADTEGPVTNWTEVTGSGAPTP